MVHFPAELVLEILSHLRKQDLKNARLVSASWRSCASVFLFDVLYLSPQDEDYTVFQAVTQNPVLSRCVRTLEYNAVAFIKTFSLSEYIARLWDQVCSPIPPNPDDCLYSINPNPEINEFVSLRKTRPLNESYINLPRPHRRRALKICKEMRFICEGWEDWKRRADIHGQFRIARCSVSVLAKQLRELEHLDTVRLSGCWPSPSDLLPPISDLPKISHGPPLARRWDMFQALPLEWDWRPDTDGHCYLHAINESRYLTASLAKAGGRLRRFQCSDSIPATAFGVENVDYLPRWHSHLLCVYAGLHHLELNLAAYDDEPDLREQDKLLGLSSIFMHARNLRHLQLTLPAHINNESDRAELFCYDKVFPDWVCWDNIESFVIENLALHIKDFIKLFLCLGMGNLKSLKMCKIRLLSGTWEAAIEILKYTTYNLERFGINPFLDEDATERRRFVFEEDDEDFAFFDSITEYVLEGRECPDLRHPCLLPEDPGKKSLEYLTEARENCEKTGAQIRVLTALDRVIRFATLMRDVRDRISEPSRRKHFEERLLRLLPRLGHSTALEYIHPS